MTERKAALKELFDRIPRRHTADNVKEMYNILDAYEDLLKDLETDDRYEQKVAGFFEVVDAIRATVKKIERQQGFEKNKRPVV